MSDYPENEKDKDWVPDGKGTVSGGWEDEYEYLGVPLPTDEEEE